MNNANKTLYIPLYGKAYVSKKRIILEDKKAEQIWKQEGFALKGKSKSKWLAYYMGMRSAVFDDWVKKQITENPNAIVLHIGCGMDSRVERVNAQNTQWYDVDFPDVIEERKRYYTENDHYHMLASDAREQAWITALPKDKDAIIVMEGVTFVKEHSMTPDYLIEQLQGMERKIFEKLYAGKMAQKMYHLYEYKKCLK